MKRKDELYIPEEGPILGRHLNALRRRIKATISDACSALGIHTPNRWYQITKEQADKPVDLTIAILLRYYLADLRRFPFTRIDMATIQKKLGLDDETFGELLGRRPLTVKQWRTKGSLPDPAVLKLANIISQMEPDSRELRELMATARHVWNTTVIEKPVRQLKPVRKSARGRSKSQIDARA